MSICKINPKYKAAFYEAVPHLFDGADGSEVEVCLVKEKPQEGFLNHDGNQFYCFKDVSKLLKAKGTSKFAVFASILKAQGQLDPIFVDEEGNVMDGYARWFGCVKEGMGTPKLQVVSGLGDDVAKITWIRSRKLARHNLTGKQRMAFVNAEIKGTRNAAIRGRRSSWASPSPPSPPIAPVWRRPRRSRP
jgi:hypothetical protein